MFNTSPDHHLLPQHDKTPLQIKQGDKFFSRLLSKETSVAADPSFRVYYGGLSCSVPFLWESQPGTPKSISSDSSIPPLTPPPCFYPKSGSKPIKNKHSRSGLLQALFPKIISFNKSNNLLPSSSSPMLLPTRSRFSTPDDDDHDIGSPTSTLCFDFGRVKYW